MGDRVYQLIVVEGGEKRVGPVLCLGTREAVVQLKELEEVSAQAAILNRGAECLAS